MMNVSQLYSLILLTVVSLILLNVVMLHESIVQSHLEHPAYIAHTMP